MGEIKDSIAKHIQLTSSEFISLLYLLAILCPLLYCMGKVVTGVG
jgi:hypothetical protein